MIVTISTGGFDSMAVDLDVPARYGIRQSVGDTVGPGGINRSLRNVPVLVGIAQDMAEVCPDAWMLNITNPMTCLTRAVCRESPVKTVGLCHEVGNWSLDLAIALGKPAEAIRPAVAGRQPPAGGDRTGRRRRGRVRRPRRRWSRRPAGSTALAPGPDRPVAEPFSRLDFVQRHVLALTLLDLWGALPAAGDRHIAEFVPWVLTEESGWGRRLQHRAHHHRPAARAPGRVRRRRRRLAGRDQAAPDLAVGRAARRRSSTRW